MNPSDGGVAVGKCRRLSILVLGLVLVLSAACGSEATRPTWIALADASHSPTRSGSPALPGHLKLRVGGEDGLSPLDVELLATLPLESFQRGEDGVWRAPQPALSIGKALHGGVYVLRFPATPFLELTSDPLWTESDSPARFQVASGVVTVALDDRDELPGDAELALVARHQEVHASGRYLVSGRRVGGEGLCVWPGESAEVTCDIPPLSTLRFACAKEAALMGPGVRQQRHRFRVFLEGAPIFEEDIEGGFESVTWFEVPLPRGGGSKSTLRFEVEGPFSFTAFLDPVIGPAEVGTYGDRPWDPEVRDVVFFLADTFRADNLRAYGGQDGRAPALDAFAEEAVLFENAWSVSTHTLPTHSTFFSGMYPRQIGQVDYFNPLPRAVDTLAEMLSRWGYRTVAITDGVMVSQTHGMSQGFGWFDERHTDMDGTLERLEAALGADDGRPLFLFVQSYASHAPFEIRATTREQLGDRFPTEGTLDDWMARLTSVGEDSQRIDLEASGTEEALEQIASMYAASVRDLDLGFAALKEQLDGSGILERGSLVVTSDHGESLGEHERVFHAGVPFEEVLRVPLMISGDGRAPARISGPVSLIDIAPTIAELAGVPPLETWLGQSLFKDPGSRPVFAFQCRGKSANTTLAVIHEGKKLIGYEDTEENEVAEWWLAYDLVRDPQELEDLFASDEGWPTDLAREMTPAFHELLVEKYEAEQSSLSADALEGLSAMGYAGSSDEE